MNQEDGLLTTINQDDGLQGICMPKVVCMKQEALHRKEGVGLSLVTFKEGQRPNTDGDQHYTIG